MVIRQSDCRSQCLQFSNRDVTRECDPFPEAADEQSSSFRLLKEYERTYTCRTNVAAGTEDVIKQMCFGAVVCLWVSCTPPKKKSVLAALDLRTAQLNNIERLALLAFIPEQMLLQERKL